MWQSNKSSLPLNVTMCDYCGGGTEKGQIHVEFGMITEAIARKQNTEHLICDKKKKTFVLV